MSPSTDRNPVAPLKPPTIVPAPQNVPVQAVTPVTHSIAWRGGPLEDRLAMYALAEKIASEEGMTPQMTEQYLATIMGESGYNQWCVNETTKDYGIAQFSAFYYLKEYKMTPDYACANPEQCLRIMARNFMGGRASNWVAFSSGGYKQHLGQKPV